VEREEFIDEILLSPSERATVDILCEGEGEVILENRTPDHTYELGRIEVSGTGGSHAASAFEELRVDPELSAERERIAGDLEREPDKTLAFVSQMPILYGSDAGEASRYVCPMHPEVTDSEASSCPKCGMKLVPDESAPASYVCPMHPEVMASEPASCPKCGMKLVASDTVPQAEGDDDGAHAHDHADGLEWEDLMPEINRQTNTENMIWQLVDRETGSENQEIRWAFQVGDRVKIRLANEMDQDHPMHHPFHVHGAGRFLVLSRDGEPEQNLAWKDTVLLRAGQTIDILLDVTNPGLWMAHCHIAEHTESGMMFSFDVAPAPERA
jgi:FtsP/CotA-like multicopper oxidase with cupredoxin domain